LLRYTTAKREVTDSERTVVTEGDDQIDGCDIIKM
jgi:hypothetical protein